MKLCKDCKHLTPHPRDPNSTDSYLCAKSRVTVHPLNGEPRLTFALNERDSKDSMACGLDAQWFEPKAAA